MVLPTFFLVKLRLCRSLADVVVKSERLVRTRVAFIALGPRCVRRLSSGNNQQALRRDQIICNVCSFRYSINWNQNLSSLYVSSIEEFLQKRRRKVCHIQISSSTAPTGVAIVSAAKSFSVSSASVTTISILRKI